MGILRDMHFHKFLEVIRALVCGFLVVATGQISVFAERETPIRTGLWVSQRVGESPATLSGFEAQIRANPNLTGVCLSIGWNDIEKESGKPDFSALDKTVTMLRRVGMKYELGVKPGMSTPSFVFEEGAQAFATRVSNPHRANVGETVAIPVPWDPVYQRNFSRLIKQLGEHYAADPLCVSVVLTCANFMSKEMHLPKAPADRAKWKAMGGNYGVELLDVYKKYTDEWAKAFPHQAISLHVSKVLDLPPEFCERIIDYGLSKYPARFTIQNCQLTGRKEDTGMMSYDLVQKYRDRARHGFQSVAAFRDSERMGSIEMAALNIVHAQGEYWELWHGDGMSLETSSAISRAWEEARRLGYDAYKQKLISEDKYRQR
jgi:Beta-galactosidase